MALVGILIALIGGAVTAMLFAGMAPPALASLPIPLAGWAGIMALGLIIYFLTRRPNN